MEPVDNFEAIKEMEMYTVNSPSAPWLSEVKVDTLMEAIQAKLGWKVNQNAHAVITNPDGYLVSEQEQQIALYAFLRGKVRA